jgi:hypothetical protein
VRCELLLAPAPREKAAAIGNGLNTDFVDPGKFSLVKFHGF